MGAKHTPEPYATDADVGRAVEDDRAWRSEASPSARYQPRVLVGDAQFAQTRRPFKKQGQWCVRSAGIARLLKPINCAAPGFPDLLVFPPFYGRSDEGARAALAKARGDQ